MSARSLTFLYAVMYVLLCVYVLSSSVGCAYEPARQFNIDSIQDKSCYNSFGGQYGYCDILFARKK